MLATLVITTTLTTISQEGKSNEQTAINQSFIATYNGYGNWWDWTSDLNGSFNATIKKIGILGTFKANWKTKT